MKTFRQIMPGDTVYRVSMSIVPAVKQDYYHSHPPYPNNVSAIDIVTLQKSKNGEYLFYDVDVERAREPKPVFRLNEEELDLGEVHKITATPNQDNQWFIYYADEESLVEDLQEIGLALLAEEDKKQARSIKAHDVNRAKIRQAFWNYLNPSLCNH